MKLKTRLLLLLALMFLASFASVAVLQSIHRAEEREAFTYRQLEREALYIQVVPLLEYPLDQFARDYSQWDEMVNFVANPSSEWARINIENSLSTFHLTAAWVLNTAGQLIYSSKEARSKTTPDFPGVDPTFVENLREKRFLSCYTRQDKTVYALRASPIQPSADLARTALPPRLAHRDHADRRRLRPNAALTSQWRW